MNQRCNDQFGNLFGGMRAYGEKVGKSLGRLALCFGLLLAAGAGCRSLPPPAEASPCASEEFALTARDRVMVLAPHPDDESLAAGGLIQAALARQLPVKVVFFTYGDNNELSFMLYKKHLVVAPSSVRAMGEVRHGEALHAASRLGLATNELVFLGYPDFGTLDIFERHWHDAPPFRSMLTRVTAVSYPDALRPGAPYCGEEILKDLTALIREFKPTVIAVSHPADFNPDHRALYAFTRVALWDLADEIQPRLLPYLVHFKNWPAPHGFYPDLPMTPPPDLAAPVRWLAFPVSGIQNQNKRSALQAHASQYAYSAGFLDAFVRCTELFGEFPVVVAGARRSALDISRDVTADEIPAEFTEEEQKVFVGVVASTIEVREDMFCVRMEFSKPLTGLVKASVYCCGYRAGVPFGNMPKLHVRVGARAWDVLDGSRRLPSASVAIERERNQITVKIPLALLGSPDRLLVCGRTYLEKLPLDWTPWRIVEL